MSNPSSARLWALAALTLIPRLSTAAITVPEPQGEIDEAFRKDLRASLEAVVTEAGATAPGDAAFDLSVRQTESGFMLELSLVPADGATPFRQMREVSRASALPQLRAMAREAMAAFTASPEVEATPEATPAPAPEPQPGEPPAVAPPEPEPASPPAAVPAPGGFASYDDILAAVDAELGKDATYAARLEAVWVNLKPFAAPESSAPKETKIDALDRFLKEFPNDNRHDVYAEKMRDAAEIGAIKVREGNSNFSGPFTAEQLRKRWELFSLTLGPGVVMSSLSFSFFTLRWSRFYWEIFRGSVLFPGILAGGIGGHGGTGIGIPFHRGDDGRREIRLGLGLEAGGFFCEVWTDADVGDRYAFGPFLVPELSFHRRNKNGVAFVTTIRVELGPVGEKEIYEEDDPETPENEEWGSHDQYFFYADAAVLFGVAY